MKIYQTSLLALSTAVAFFSISAGATDCADCGVLIRPAAFYGISSTSTKTTTALGPFQPDPFLSFKLSQTGNGKTLQSENDLVAYYSNVQCGTTSLEFLFEPISDYDYGGNTKIDVFTVTSIPRDANGKPVPTWDNLKTATGPLVGSFRMPNSEATQVHKNFKIGKVPCGSDVLLRLSISNSGYASGSVNYAQDYSGYVTGLKLRLGC